MADNRPGGPRSSNNTMYLIVGALVIAVLIIGWFMYGRGGETASPPTPTATEPATPPATEPAPATPPATEPAPATPPAAETPATPPAEPAPALGVRIGRKQDLLQRHRTVEQLVMRAPDHAHAASADLFQQPVSPRDKNVPTPVSHVSG